MARPNIAGCAIKQGCRQVPVGTVCSLIGKFCGLLGFPGVQAFLKKRFQRSLFFCRQNAQQSSTAFAVRCAVMQIVTALTQQDKGLFLRMLRMRPVAFMTFVAAVFFVAFVVTAVLRMRAMMFMMVVVLMVFMMVVVFFVVMLPVILYLKVFFASAAMKIVRRAMTITART